MKKDTQIPFSSLLFSSYSSILFFFLYGFVLFFYGFLLGFLILEGYVIILILNPFSPLFFCFRPLFFLCLRVNNLLLTERKKPVYLEKRENQNKKTIE